MIVIPLQAAIAAGMIMLGVFCVLIILFLLIPIPLYKLVKSWYMKVYPNKSLSTLTKLCFLLIAYLMAGIVIFILGGILFLMFSGVHFD